MKLPRGLVQAVLLFCAAAAGSPASAQEKTGTAEGFALEPGTARIVLMRPSIMVGEQSTGGLLEPNADWTDQAREHLERELEAAQASLGNQIVRYEGTLPAPDPLASQYERLFGTVASSVVEYQFFPGNRLPTKKRDGDQFEWSMGPGLTEIDGLEGADYLLFITTRDAYGSTGRKVLQIVGLLAGVGVTSGEHWGFAGLVELKTGRLVWLNADMQMGGDVRTAEGAKKRVGQLLEGFPGANPGGAGD